jgi:hypothetical protein
MSATRRGGDGSKPAVTVEITLPEQVGGGTHDDLAEPAVAPAPEPAMAPPPTAATDEEVTCPNCGAVARISSARRDSEAFCPTPLCDFPLFWAQARRPAAPPVGDDGDGALRRLPGTVGRSSLASLPCPACHERNSATGVFCVRCGAELRPAPVVVRAPEPAPAPPPVVDPEPPTPWWPYAFAAFVVVYLAVCVTLLYL